MIVFNCLLINHQIVSENQSELPNEEQKIQPSAHRTEQEEYKWRTDVYLNVSLLLFNNI